MVYVIAGIFGLIFGSFLNVCIYRIPRGESIIRPRSHCPQCGRLIRWYDNIPVLSYLTLRGRCRNCGASISLLYPFVETLTAAVWIAVVVRYGVSLEFVKYVVLAMLLLILILTDLRERRIPHGVTLYGIAVGLLFSFFIPVDDRLLAWILRQFGLTIGGPASSFLGSVSGGLVAGGFFYVVGEAFYRLRHKEGLGFGDVMLMLMIGTFFGIPLTLLTILLGSLLGTLVAGPLSLALPRFRDYEWPYGSFLGLAAIYCSLGGTALLDAYLHWSGFR